MKFLLEAVAENDQKRPSSGVVNAPSPDESAGPAPPTRSPARPYPGVPLPIQIVGQGGEQQDFSGPLSGSAEADGAADRRRASG